jgi:hypothetical protein
VAKLTINGIAGLDGDYEFDDSRFTMRDFHTIKRIAGIRAGELMDAYLAGDTDLRLALAVIALERNGRTGVEEQLWGAELGAIRLELGDGDEESPPAEAAGSKTSSGGSSTPGSDPQETPPSPTGDQP